MCLLHLCWIKAKWLGSVWSTEYKGNRQREVHDMAKGGPWSKVGEVSVSAVQRELVRLTGSDWSWMAVGSSYGCAI